jgi:hypothetical protein
VRPRVELLEDRVYPGDTLLGLWALGFWGSRSASQTPASFRQDALIDQQGQHHNSGLYRVDTLSAVLLPPSLPDDADLNTATGYDDVIFKTAETVLAADAPFVTVENLDRSVVREGMTISSSLGSQAQPVPPAGTLSGFAASWSDSSAALFALAVAGNGDRAGRSSQLLAAALPDSTPLAFDQATGQLAIREDSGEHTVREGIAADGFVEVTLDGQLHSSNPGSGSFDRALAGATNATIADIHFAGAAQDTLVLDSQQLAGGLTVQAPNITVHGAVQAGSVALTAAAWVNIESAARTDAVASHGQARSIAVSADVFVNAGQVHADGSSGGQVRVQARNILNAGPITADGTSSGADGGAVHLGFTESYVGTTAGLTSARGAHGGSVVLDGDATGHLFSSGQHLVTGSVAGTVDLFGRDIVLSGATVDAAGEVGGGAVRIGGDFRGSNPARVNADTVTVTPATTIRADALHSGDGGRVFVGANQTASFGGIVSARGGPVGGNSAEAPCAQFHDLPVWRSSAKRSVCCSSHARTRPSAGKFRIINTTATKTTPRATGWPSTR